MLFCTLSIKPFQNPHDTPFLAEPELVHLLWSPGIDSQPCGIDFLELIPGLLKRLQIWAQLENTPQQGYRGYITAAVSKQDF
jgi:hypothetical protein